jgi:hypothetical protein
MEIVPVTGEPKPIASPLIISLFGSVFLKVKRKYTHLYYDNYVIAYYKAFVGKSWGALWPFINSLVHMVIVSEPIGLKIFWTNLSTKHSNVIHHQKYMEELKSSPKVC